MRELYLNIEDFNKKLAEYSYMNINLIQDKIHIYFINGEVKYITNLTGKADVKPCIPAIAKQFNKITNKCFELENKENYGYEKIYNGSYSDYKVKWNLKENRPFSYIDDEYRGKELKCYSYDINSAYSYAMTQLLPDTSIEPRLNTLLEAGEIGFSSDGTITKKPGALVNYAFKQKIYPEFVEYVNIYYKKKANAKTKEEKAKWKFYLNIPTGLLQRNNIFLRLAILRNSEEYISSFIDENTIYCNVDSIISLTKRNDLPLSNNLGDFKEEHINESFKFLDTGIYQWNENCHYRGISGESLLDIEDTENWLNNLPYIINNQNQIIKRSLF